MNNSTKPASKWKTWHKVVIGICAVFFVLILVSDPPKEKDANTNISTSTAPEKKKEPELTVSSTKLYQDYDANEIDADNAYKGKLIQVNGKIIDIGKDITNDAYVLLNVGKDPYQMLGVQCMLKYPALGSGLKKGDVVTVIGKCDGKLGNVFIRNCDLTKAE